MLAEAQALTVVIRCLVQLPHLAGVQAAQAVRLGMVVLEVAALMEALLAALAQEGKVTMAVMVAPIAVEAVAVLVVVVELPLALM